MVNALMLLAMDALRDENIAPCGGVDEAECDRQDAQASADTAQIAGEFDAQTADITAQLAALAQAFEQSTQALNARKQLALARRNDGLALRARRNKDAIRRLVAAGHVLIELKAAQLAAEKADRPHARTKFTLKLYGFRVRCRRCGDARSPAPIPTRYVEAVRRLTELKYLDAEGHVTKLIVLARRFVDRLAGIQDELLARLLTDGINVSLIDVERFVSAALEHKPTVETVAAAIARALASDSLATITLDFELNEVDTPGSTPVNSPRKRAASGADAPPAQSPAAAADGPGTSTNDELPATAPSEPAEPAKMPSKTAKPAKKPAKPAKERSKRAKPAKLSSKTAKPPAPDGDDAEDDGARRKRPKAEMPAPLGWQLLVERADVQLVQALIERAQTLADVMTRRLDEAECATPAARGQAVLVSVADFEGLNDAIGQLSAYCDRALVVESSPAPATPALCFDVKEQAVPCKALNEGSTQWGLDGRNPADGQLRPDWAAVCAARGLGRT